MEFKFLSQHVNLLSNWTFIHVYDELILQAVNQS